MKNGYTPGDGPRMHVLTDRLARSLLFVPGNSPEKIWKASRFGADCLILDLEDSVPETEKSVARAHVKSALESLAADEPFVLVRVNSLTSPHWLADCRSIAKPALRAIVLPKCDSPTLIVEADRVLRAEEESQGLATGSILLVLLIESARALLEAAAMVQASPRVVAVAFGAEDYCLDMGIVRTRDGNELNYARGVLAVVAHAHGCMAIDAIFADFKDKEGLANDALVAKSLGFSGKLAIHPSQIKTIHLAFSPREAEIKFAKRLLESIGSTDAHVISLDGKMIDRPIIERARRLLAAHERASNKKNASPGLASKSR